MNSVIDYCRAAEGTKPRRNTRVGKRASSIWNHKKRKRPQGRRGRKAMKKKYELTSRCITWSPRFVPQEFVDDLQHAIDQAFNNRQEGLQVRVQQLLHNPLLTNIQDTNTVVKYIYSVPEADKGIKYRHECMLRIERQEKGYDLQLVRMRLISDLRKVIKHLRKSLKNNYVPGGEYNFEREAKA